MKKTNWDNVKLDPNFDGSFILDEDFDYYPLFDSGCKIVFKAGLSYNGGSIPRFLTPILPRFGKCDKAYLIHDLMYSGGIATRLEADIELRLLLRECGVGLIKRNLIYRSVRLFGGSFYKGIDQD